jgi:methyltransferase-like protein/SAM-dependent methyltransferase
MTQATPNTYDEVSYPSYPFPQSHPDRLATLATLFGIAPAPVDDCRVLEIGCGNGANLIPMALLLPKSRFVGVDLAAHPIARGRATAEALGLGNIALQRLDIMDLSPEFGQFDYVIAHGIYSWVPPVVRDKLLAICKANLTADGVAYISYNTYPGGHLRQMMREMMLYHIRDIREPDERIRQARAFVGSLAASQSEASLYSMILASMERELERIEDGSLYHDQLAETNSPVYFHQFIDHARQHGLQYLAEADFFDMQYEGASETIRQTGDDPIASEQYMDFLTCRRFRQTLLCHKEIAIDRRLNPERISGLFVASSARPVFEEPVVDSRSVERFQSDKTATMSTNHPLTKAAISQLGKIWPRSLRFDDLLRAARLELGPNAARRNGHIVQDDALMLGEFLLKAYAGNMVELHAYPSQFVLEPSERPVASRLARLQLENDTAVTTLRHTTVRVTGDLGINLLMLLDGSRDRRALLEELGRLVESGRVIIHREGKEIFDKGEALKVLADELEQNLARIAKLALLVA